MGRLILPLKGVWYDSIESLEKPEEYREITPYWVSRFVDGEYTYVLPPIGKSQYDQLEYERRIYNFFLKSKAGRKFFNSFDELEFTKGYPKKGDTNRRMIKQSPIMKLETLEEKLNGLIKKDPLDKWMNAENIQHFLDKNGIKFRFEPTLSLGEKGKIVLIDGKWIYRFSDDKPGCCIRLLF